VVIQFEAMLPDRNQIANYKSRKAAGKNVVQALLDHIGTKTIHHIVQVPLIISDAPPMMPIKLRFFSFDFINGTPLLGTGST
jgi:hypothetical protein